MPGPNRGALPLALLIVAALAGGIVVAVMRIDERGRGIAGPGPTVTSPAPTIPSPTVESPSPTSSPEPTVEPTTEPTESPSPKPEPTEEPTDAPSPEPTDDGNGTVLAQTGGPVLPYFLGGALMIAGSAGIWRLRRIFD